MRPEAHLVAAAIRNRELTVCGADMLYGELESQLVPQPAGGDELYGKRHHWNVTARFEPPARVSRRLLRDVHKDVFNDVSYREGGSGEGRNTGLGTSTPME